MSSRASSAKPFEGMEGNGNPWNLARVDSRELVRGPRREELRGQTPTPRCCSGSVAPRATMIAPRKSRAARRSCCSLPVFDFAILAEEETCTGDPARRAGNEYLYSMLAETTRPP